MAKRSADDTGEPDPIPTKRRIVLTPLPERPTPAPASRPSIQDERWQDIIAREEKEAADQETEPALRERERIRALASAETPDPITVLYDMANTLSEPVYHEELEGTRPSTVVFGYAEIRLDSVRELFRALELKPGASFLDIGSGFGKIVMHAAIEHGVDAKGVEYHAKRVETSRKIQAVMRQRLGPMAPAALSDPMLFEEADATTWRRTLDFDTIFSYDLLFRPETVRQIDRVLARSAIRYYVDCVPPEKHTFGRAFELVRPIVLINDGGERHKFYIYAKRAKR